MKSKLLTKSGGLTIPAALRRDINLMPGDAVDIDIKDNQLIIAAHIDRCFICRSEKDVVIFGGKAFCKECITNMGVLINE